MALRGVLTHRKTRRLAKILGIDQCGALGVLEALWHVTAENQPDGGIGRMKNSDIADEMFSDRDPDELIAALEKSGWIDTSESCRLFVHDWHEHADDSIRSKMIQWTRLFANGEPPRLTKISKDSRPRIIAKYVERHGEIIRRKMESVRTEEQPAHDAHGGHIQSQSPEPESRVQSPEEVRTRSIPVNGKAPLGGNVENSDPPPGSPATSRQPGHEPPTRKPRSSAPPVETPRKPMEVPRAPAAQNLTAERIRVMRATLHGYMAMHGTAHERNVPTPDDPVVLRCLSAVGDAPMDAVAAYLRDLFVNRDQSPRHANGPQSYPWFVSVLAARFRDGPGEGALSQQSKSEPVGARP
jgi:hypothetical protein